MMMLVQAALEAIPEQRTERLSFAHAIEQREREAHAPRREIDRQRTVLFAAMGQMTGSQHRRSGRLPERRRMDVAVAGADGASRPHVFEHAESAEPRAEGFRVRSAASLREAIARSPRIEAMRGDVERASRQPRERRGRQR